MTEDMLAALWAMKWILLVLFVVVSGACYACTPPRSRPDHYLEWREVRHNSLWRCSCGATGEGLTEVQNHLTVEMLRQDIEKGNRHG